MRFMITGQVIQWWPHRCLDNYFPETDFLCFWNTCISTISRVRWLVIDWIKSDHTKIFCTDQSDVLSKGHLIFREYIPTKRHRLSIKVFIICDWHTEVMLGFIVCTRSSTEVKLHRNLAKSGCVIISLMEPHVNKGHSLFIYNRYAIPCLFEKLHYLKTTLV